MQMSSLVKISEEVIKWKGIRNKGFALVVW